MNHYRTKHLASYKTNNKLASSLIALSILILFEISLFSTTSAHENQSCHAWFADQNISTNDPECVLLCNGAPVGLGTFSCKQPGLCEHYCTPPEPEPEPPLPELGSDCDQGSDSRGCPVWQVNKENLNLYVVDTPIWYDSPIGPSVAVSISYNSHGDREDTHGLGENWRLNYSASIRFEGDDAIVTMADGRKNRFTASSILGNYNAPSGIYDQLEAAANGDLILTLRNGTRLLFRQIDTSTEIWRLIETRDINNLSLQFTYNDNQLTNITDAQGRLTQLVYNTGRLSRINDPFGRQATLAYNSFGQLQTITDMGGLTSQIGYDANGSLNNIDKPGFGAWEFTHEPSDNNTTPTNFPAPGAIMGEHYRLTITDPEQRKTEYFFDALANETLIVKPKHYTTYTSASENNSNNPKTTYRYTNNFGKPRLSNKVDELSLATEYTYTSTGLLSAIIDADNIDNRFAYTSSAQIAQQREDVANSNRTTDFEYLQDYSNLITRISEPSVADGRKKISTITYDSNRFIDRITIDGFTPSGNAVSRQFNFDFNALGQLLNIDGPRQGAQDTSTFSYYDCAQLGLPANQPQCGQLHTQLNALGHMTTFDSYTLGGLLEQSTDANNIVRQYQYDNLNRLIQLTEFHQSNSASSDPLDKRITRFSYIGAKQHLASIEYPDSIQYRFTYDAAEQLVLVTDNVDNRLEYRYDRNGQRIQEDTVDSNNQLAIRLSETYDAIDRRLTTAFGNSINQFSYNGRDLLNSHNDPNNNLNNEYQYDGLSRLTQFTDSLSNSTLYAYNIDDQLTQVTATNGSVTDYVYDDLGSLLSEASADRGLMTYIHDTAGNVVTQTDARGVTVHYQYDALNRLTDVSFPNSSEDIRYGYDSCPILGVGRLCTLDHEAGSEALAYDSWGNVIMQVREERGQDLAQTITATTRYAYDAANRVMQITYPSGRVVDYSRDAIGRLIAATSIASDGEVTDLFSNRQYRADGLWMAQDYGAPNSGSNNALSQTKQYDQQGRLLAHLAGDYNRQYQYDANGNIVDITGSLNSLYRYDPLDRLIENTANDLGVQSGFSYDANGNRTIATKSGGNSLFLNYADNSNRLTQVSGNPVTLDSSGRTISDANGRYYHYNDAGRLAALRQGGSTGAVIAQYHYNSNQLRTRKTVGADTTLYHYDLAGNMLAESDETGEFTHEYVYADGERIALFTSAVSNGAELNLSNHVAFHAQDQASSGEVVADSSQIALNGNRWRATPVNYTITPNTILEFDFSSTQQGEIHGVGLDSDLSLNPHRLFHLYGTQAYGNRTYSTYSGSGVEHFFIPIGQYYQGDASYLFFAMDDDVNQAGNSVFSNVRLYESSEQTLQTEQRVNLSDVQSYGGSQDGQGVVDVIDDGGQALRLHGNRWQRIAMPVVITPTMRLEFDFKSSVQGEIHGIGVDTNNGISVNQTFQLYGSQTWGIQSYRNYVGQGDYQSYSLPIGEHVTGLYDYITFTMDDDASAQGESVFRNVRFVDQAVGDNAPAQTATYFYINDHLGTPQRLLDQNGEVSWEAGYEAFGLATINTAEVEQNHRFLGQYYDQESGLHYNWHRYYDPTLGRYVTSDPIGLNGGLNTFGYVDQNPLMYSDPYGLTKRGGRVEININQPFLNTQYNSLLSQIRQFEPSFRPPSSLRRPGSGVTRNEVRSLQQSLVNARSSGFCGPGASQQTHGTFYVDSFGNIIVTPFGGFITGSPNGQFIQARDANGVVTGVRKDGGHRPANHPDPRAQRPHGHVPGITNADGTPWLPLNN